MNALTDAEREALGEWPNRHRLTPLVERIVAARVAEAVEQECERALRPFEVLFGGGPDTPCRTTRPEGVECVEVPMDDLRSAFDCAYLPAQEES